jgi:hypothetical protein
MRLWPHVLIERFENGASQAQGIIASVVGNLSPPEVSSVRGRQASTFSTAEA